MRGPARARALVLAVALAAYANSVGNGFALDDNWFIVGNPVVTDARYDEAFTRSAWPGALEGTGNYRPVTLSSFATEWALWGPSPLGYHVVNVVVHALVCLLVLGLLGAFVRPVPALVGALFFAIHPVHVEAVANVMGRAELYAAAGYLGACLLYLRDTGAGASARGGRLVSLVVLFLLAAGSKEIAVTLPAMLMALEIYRPSSEPAGRRLAREAPTYVALFATLGCYVIARWNAVGAVGGHGVAAGLVTIDTPHRILTALTVWPQYVRLLFFPLDLSADYSAAVLLPATSVDLAVVLGFALLTGAVVGAVALRTRESALALGLAWFVIAISPISNLLLPVDVLLAERNLYLPSVGAAFAVSAVAAHVARAEPRAHRAASVAALLVGSLLLVRTVLRNPTWVDTFTVLRTLAADHPESWMSQRALAMGYERVGDDDAARRAYEAGIEIAPDNYQILVEAGTFYDRIGEPGRAEEVFRRAIAVRPLRPEAYARLSEGRIRRGDGRGGHAAALEGIRTARADRNLWALVSESYVMKADLEAAVRARRASIGVEETANGWNRLGELYDALGRPRDASAARARAAAIPPEEGS